jgi:uncharacterized protein (DUF305 family)
MAVALVMVSGCVDEGDEGPPMIDPGLELYATDADIAFLQQMHAHHGQAVQLGLHATRNGSDDQVRGLALDVAVSQAQEQGQIEAMLVDRGASSGSADVHADMEGMISAADLADALRMEGAELDRRFAELMLDHHRGAVTTAQTAVADGDLTPTVVAFAMGIVTSQQREITDLELMLG